MWSVSWSLTLKYIFEILAISFEMGGDYFCFQIEYLFLNKLPKY